MQGLCYRKIIETILRKVLKLFTLSLLFIMLAFSSVNFPYFGIYANRNLEERNIIDFQSYVPK